MVKKAPGAGAGGDPGEQHAGRGHGDLDGQVAGVVALPHAEDEQRGDVQRQDPAQEVVPLPERLLVERVAAGQVEEEGPDRAGQQPGVALLALGLARLGRCGMLGHMATSAPVDPFGRQACVDCSAPRHDSPHQANPSIIRNVFDSARPVVPRDARPNETQ